MYLDIRQIFSIWFVPMYHAHVRLVTVLDLVANDDPNYHDPLDRLIKQEEASEADEKAEHLPHASQDQDHRTWKIHTQEDLYQVNEFLKFTGLGFLSFLWFLFQLSATAICVFMSLFLPLSPWAFQKEPARGGVEATIERIEAYHDDESKSGGKARAGSTSGEDSYGGGGGSAATNGNRRGSANSKASSSTPKKPWKNGSHKKGSH